MPNPPQPHSALPGPTRPYSALLGPTRPEPAATRWACVGSFKGSASSCAERHCGSLCLRLPSGFGVAALAAAIKYTYIHIYIYTYTHIHIYIYISIYISMDIHVDIHIRLHIHRCIHTICIYIHAIPEYTLLKPRTIQKCSRYTSNEQSQQPFGGLLHRPDDQSSSVALTARLMTHVMLTYKRTRIFGSLFSSRKTTAILLPSKAVT